MWCRDCQKEVRPQVSGVSSVLCPGCGRLITSTHLPKSAETIRQAREILERWQSTDLFDQISATGALQRIGSGSSDTSRVDGLFRMNPASTPTEFPEQKVPATDWSLINPGNSPSTPKVDQQLTPVLGSAPVLAATAPELPADTDATSAPMVGVLLAGVEESRVSMPVKAHGMSLASEAAGPQHTPESHAPQFTEELRSAPPAAAIPERSLQSASSTQANPVMACEASTDASGQHAVSENHAPSDPTPEPKKPSRAPLRRPPLHRRFQMDRPSTSEISPGSPTVDRKLRLDQPGGGPTASQPEQNLSHSLPSSVAPETRIVANSPAPGRRLRIDRAASVDEITGTDRNRTRTQGKPRSRMIDESHGTQLRGPHFQITAPKRSNLTTITGQFLAYLGVLGLTIGTAMVIYGHFGGYSEITPTGWLVTTVAQMLLFLGVINLVSGGIEQTNDDVSRRINSLGEQLMRIEQVTSDVLRGPKISPQAYDDPDQDPASAEQRAVASRHE